MFCTDIPSPVALIFSDSTPYLLYYSHLPAVFAALLVGLLVYSKSKSLEARLLLAIAALFSLWNLIDLVTWTNVDSRSIMFVWSMMNFVALLIAVVTLYFSYVFLEKRDVSWKVKFIVAALLLPYLLLLPTSINISTFDLDLCEAEQGLLDWYFYFLQIFFLTWTSIYFFQKYFRAEALKKMQALYLSLGAVIFLALFFGGTFVANITDTWEYEQYGLFGMIFFLALLTVLIVRYHAFNMKLIGAQALVIGLVLLIGSQYFFTREFVNIVLISITLLLVVGFGIMLIHSVKGEIRRKEELQKISDALAIANERLKELDMAKSEFISIASHQLRTPLTAIKGYVSLLLEGSYGKVPAPIQDILDKIYTINGRLVQLVEDLLNISRIEAGRLQYNFQPTQIEPLVAELVDMFSVTAKNKQLTLNIHLPKHGLPKLTIDPNKIKEVVSNLIDNALKYTKAGAVTVSVEATEHVARIIVSDTGIGIRSEDKEKLFEKFIRTKETTKMVVSGTGLGLYVGKNFVEAHGGRIWAESDGPDKGSRFIIELPFVNPKVQEGISDQSSSLGRGK